MLGVNLLYVGSVLAINGIGRLSKIDGKSLAIMNFFTGGLSVLTNIILLTRGEYYAAATGLLFGFTYLFIALNAVFNLDGRVLSWFSLFVAINTIPAAMLSLLKENDTVFFGIWLAWGVLWLMIFIEGVLKKDLKNTVPVLLILEGIFTAWIPGWLILQNVL